MDKFYAVSWSTRPTLTWCDFYKEAYLKEYLEKYKDMKVYYNPETHELVEKKDAKTKRLELDIKQFKDGIKTEEDKINSKNAEIDICNTWIRLYKEEIEKLTKELKELE